MSDLPVELLDYPDYDNQLEHRRVLQARSARTRPAEDHLPDSLARRFPHELYTHQAEALDRLAGGENVCVSTSTSSGKTYVYALEIARQHRRDPSATALLVYPTRALSSDQKEELDAFFSRLDLDLRVGVYDGDASAGTKRDIRENADVVLTNFAGLNYYLPHHQKWDRILSNLRTVVVEEAHAYSGILGMHAAWILRRLFRLVESDRYRSEPRVILTSATIGNPGDHAERLTGKTVTVVDNDGSPRSAREILLWNPPKFHEASEHRKSAHRESSQLLAHLVDTSNQMILFAPSRKMTELNTRWTREFLAENGSDGNNHIDSYHAGHTRDERKSVEQKLKESTLDGVIATSALELGVNIGGIDGAILSGYPGSRQRFWQRLGRSGREGKQALNVLVAQESALDQYIMRHPDYLLDGDVENAVLDLNNNTVFLAHLRIAASELPLTEYDEIYFGDRLKQGTDFLRKTGDVSGSLESSIHYTGSNRPETRVDLYGAGESTFEVLLVNDDGEQRTLDNKITTHRAYRDFHPGAIYLHKDQQYRVRNFEEQDPNPRVTLEAVNVDYYTTSSRKPDITGVEPETSRKFGSFVLHRGRGTVEEYFPSYKHKDIDTQTVKETRRTGLDDPVTLNTQLIWLELPRALPERIRNRYSHQPDPEGTENDPFLGGIHAIEHGLVHMAPSELLIDKADLGGLSVNDHPDTVGPAIFLYDAVDGGLGFTWSMYEQFRSLADRTRDLIEACECDGTGGCPACVMDYRCGNNNSPLHTSSAVRILEIFGSDTTEG